MQIIKYVLYSTLLVIAAISVIPGAIVIYYLIHLEWNHENTTDLSAADRMCE